MKKGRNVKKERKEAGVGRVNKGRERKKQKIMKNVRKE
jgi:hypothetical protein